MAEEKLKASRGRRERAWEIEWTQDTLLESYVEMVPRLEGLTLEERHRIYRMLGLRVTSCADETLAVSGILRDLPRVRDDSAPTSGSTTAPKARSL